MKPEAQVRSDQPTHQQLSEQEQARIVDLARQATRAYFLGKSDALEEAMLALNAAFLEIDGIDYEKLATAER
ncbi:MAG TPA: hypothetical protein VGX68_06590 [Thermoanaerobaculia bacterium]|nr:hypothetical protein [Thermoanaerobaculia bacterium]